jgi:hypothetical protein
MKTFCIDSVLKHCAANRKIRLSALPNLGPYTYDVKTSGFTRSSIYIYVYIYIYDSRIRVNVFGTPDVEPKDISTTSVRDLCLFIRGTWLLILC